MNQRSGFTILELTVSIAIGLILMVGVMGVSSEAAKFSSHVDDHSTVRYEATRAYTRVTEVLRKTGWNDLAGTQYPLVSPDLSRLSFRTLTDTDGNGYPFDGTTGDLEWNTDIFHIRVDDENVLGVFDGPDADANRVWILGRHITSVQFRTYLQDGSVFLPEIRVRIESTQRSHRGYDVNYVAEGSIHMRN